MKRLSFLGLVALCLMFLPDHAGATPSTQIWIPSTDIQPFRKLHLGLDSFIKAGSHDGVTEPTVTNVGLTLGILPFEKIQMEAGMDFRDTGGDHKYPLYLNAKLGIPEEALFTGSPAIAIGGYDFGTKKDGTDYNIIYGIFAKTIGKLGRFSAGYYYGNDDLLKDINGKRDNHGVLLSWDRTLTEISDKLWAAIDYQGRKEYLWCAKFWILL